MQIHTLTHHINVTTTSCQCISFSVLSKFAHDKRLMTAQRANTKKGNKNKIKNKNKNKYNI